jgi:hypothetical protein
VQLSKIIVGLLVVSHWLGCLWVVLSRAEDFSGVGAGRCPSATQHHRSTDLASTTTAHTGLVADGVFSKRPLGDQYLLALQWGMRALLCFATNDPTYVPRTRPQVTAAFLAGPDLCPAHQPARARCTSRS